MTGIAVRAPVREDAELAARRSLRAQIVKLERELADAFLTAVPMGGLDPVADASSAQPRLPNLGELEQSLDLLLASPADRPPSVVDPSRVGTGQASVETPRGAATLRIQLDGGYVTHAELWSPSQRLAELISPVSEGRELADALLGIASLDLSPWELGR